MRSILLLLLALLVGTGTALAEDPPTPSDDAPKTEKPAPEVDGEDAEAEAEEEEEKEPEYEGPGKAWDEATEDTEFQEGLFGLHVKTGALLLELDPKTMGDPFLINHELARGIGARGLNGGSMLVRKLHMVSFERHGDKIYMIRMPYRHRASGGEAAWEAVMDLSFDGSIMHVAEIASEHEDGRLLVDIHDWMMEDNAEIGQWVKWTVGENGRPGQASLDGKRTYLESTKSFPDNLNFRVKQSWKLGKTDHGIASLVDPATMPLTIHSSWVRLPEKPMKPRVADDRTGYFLTVHKDFTLEKDNFFQRYVNRWRLEKGSQRGGLFEPVEPITYYIDHTVPKKYRKYIKQGVEAWQPAYEAAGWKNAIIAKDLPKDAEAEDIRYATIRWMATDQPGYLAIGPSVVDPRTGEILDADILMDASFALRASDGWKDLVNPARTLENYLDRLECAPTADSAYECEATGEMAALQMGMARLGLLERGEMVPGQPMPEEYMGQFLVWVTMHEVGHTLGLRHNFKSSRDTPFASLHDKDFTNKNGLTSSVMDYAAPNLAPKGQKNGSWFGSSVGTADHWMIRFGYTDRQQAADKIAREAAKAGHTYGTDEDRLGPGAMDPYVNAWDLGSDPLAWGMQRSEICMQTLPNLDKFTLVDNARPQDLTNNVGVVVGNYSIAMTMGLKYIGGADVNRDHVGDAGARAPFVPIPRAKSMAALEHMMDGIFAEDALQIPTNLVKKMGPDRFSHWGNRTTMNGRVDYPIHDITAGIQRRFLFSLTEPMRLARVADQEKIFGADEVLTLPELFSALSSATWSELDQGGEISSTRRMLQRAWVDRMGDLLLSGSGFPADAIALSRAELKDTQARIQTRLEAGGDRMTTAHLSELDDRIDAMLDAQVAAKS